MVRGDDPAREAAHDPAWDMTAPESVSEHVIGAPWRSLEMASTASRGPLRLRTLVMIRWVAVTGQLVAILVVQRGLGFDVPMEGTLATVGASILVNVVAVLVYPQAERLSERGAALFLAYDIMQLAVLLVLTGGLQNPFALLLLVPVTISATTLRLPLTISLCTLVLVCASLLAVYHLPLPWGPEGFVLPVMYTTGVWVALILGAPFISLYAWRVAEESRRMSDALAATQSALAHEQQFSALGALAGAAAHALGSPLGTIAVVAKEISRDLPEGSPLTEDVDLLIEQTGRCREILVELARSDGMGAVSPFQSLSLASLIDEVAAPYRRDGVTVRFEIAASEKNGGDGPPSVPRRPEILHGLGNLIENAVEFARSEVILRVFWNGSLAGVEILDDGPGIAPHIIGWLGEPYVSSRRESGGMGLGVFIAKTLLERTGADVRFGHRPGGGAVVVVAWPRQRIDDGDDGE